MSSPHLVFVTRGLHDGGGTERVTSFVASSLAERGYLVSIVCLQRGRDTYFPLSEKVKVYYLRKSFCWNKIHELKAIYKRIKPDLIFAVGTNRSHLHLFASKGYPLVSWEHFNTAVCSHPFHQLSRCLASKRGWVITLTEEDASSYRKRWKAKRVVTIPNPLTIKGLYREEKEHKCVLAEKKKKKVKGFDRLLRAWQKVHLSFPSWRLRIVGSGSEEKSLKALCSQLGLDESVEMIPHQADVKPYFAKADIFALSSRYEGFGLVLIEAFAAGLPAVAFDVPRGPREIMDTSSCGIMVEEGNIEAYATALKKLIGNRTLRLEMGMNARARSKDFLPERVIDLWQNFINHLLDNSESFDGNH